MTLKRELESQNKQLIYNNQQLAKKINYLENQVQRMGENNCKYDLHTEQLNETNKRLGNTIAQYEKELQTKDERFKRKYSVNDALLQNERERFDIISSKLRKLEKKYNVARKFIRSIDGV